MATKSIWPEKIDRDRVFTARRGFRHNGRDYWANEVFDKETATTRTLRRLVDARYIVMQPAGYAAASIPDDARVDETTEPAEVRHVGRGRFAVFKDGARASEPMSREEAEAAVEAS